VTKTNAPETIGARIRRLRDERGLSQRDLADPARRVSFSYLSRIETGEREPSVKALRVIAQKLGVTPEYLETGRDVPAWKEREVELSDAELQLRLSEFASARERFERIRQEAEADNDRPSADRARAGLALAATAEGKHLEAITLLEVALSHERPAVVDSPDLYAVLGRSYAAVGELARAVELFRSCLAEIEGAEEVDGILFLRFASYLSYALIDVGDRAGAQAVLADALQRAQTVRDTYSLVRLYWSLGRTHEQERPDQALDYFQRAIALLETTEDRFYLARAHEACASILLDHGRGEGAREHLEAAETLYAASDPNALGSVWTEWARLALLEADLEGARSSALKALDLLEDAELFKVGDAWRTLGEVFDRLGEADLADRFYRTAIETLTRHGAVKNLAETYTSYARFLGAEGREHEELAVLRRLRDLKSAPAGEEDARSFREPTSLAD